MIWRINMGYRKRSAGEPEGFWLDTERGYWAKRPDEVFAYGEIQDTSATFRE